MEAGVSYNKQRVHRDGYSRELLATNSDIDEGLFRAATMPRNGMRCRQTESAMGRSLERDSLMRNRVGAIMNDSWWGSITALTWGLEVGTRHSFSSIKKSDQLTAGCVVRERIRNMCNARRCRNSANTHYNQRSRRTKMAPRYSRT